jgi:ribonuclease Z
MKLTFLGTSAGKPTRERNVSALALECEQERRWYLFDCGEGTQHQLLRSRLSFGKLGVIFITHLHGDHYYGLPGLLSTKKLDRSTSPVTLYGPRGIRAFVEASLKTSPEHLGYDLQIIEFAAGDSFMFERFSVQVLPLVHSVESFAFAIKEHDTANRLDEPKLRAMGVEPSPLYGRLKQGHSVVHDGKRIEPSEVMLDPLIGRSLIIAGDNSDPLVLGERMEDVDLLVHESTYTQAVFDALMEKTLHTTAKGLAAAAQAKGVKNLIATHINARYAPGSRHALEEIETELKAGYPGNVYVANDFDAFYLKRGGILEYLGLERHISRKGL